MKTEYVELGYSVCIYDESNNKVVYEIIYSRFSSWGTLFRRKMQLLAIL